MKLIYICIVKKVINDTKESKDMKESEIVMQKVEDFIIDEFARYIDAIGGKVMMGRIFGLLVTKHEPMSLTQIAQRLQVSKPAISTTIKALVEIRFLQKVYNPEFPREDFYIFTHESMEMVIDPGIVKLENLMERIDRATEMIEKEAKDIERSEELKQLDNKLKVMRDSFAIVLEEYYIFGERVKERIRKMSEEMH